MALFYLLDFGKPDREYTNESDGQHFNGYDDKETGMTTWYDDDGVADCQLPTPVYEDDF